MFETMASVMLGDQLSGMTFEPPLGPWGYKRMLAPARKPYPTKDGFVAALPYRDEQWKAFFGAVGKLHLLRGRSALHDRRRAPRERQRSLRHGGGRSPSSAPTAEWLAFFKTLDIAAMPVNSIEDVIDSRHLEDVGFFQTVEHPSEGTLRRMRPAATWSDTPLAPGRPAPNLGEHSSEVLSEVGYTADKVASLVDRNVIKQWKP